MKSTCDILQFFIIAKLPTVYPGLQRTVGESLLNCTFIINNYVHLYILTGIKAIKKFRTSFFSNVETIW